MSAIRGSSVFITGATGFVGVHLCRLLLERGATCAGVGLRAPEEPVKGLAWSKVDLLDASAIADAIRSARPDIVVHLAGQASAGQSFRTPEATFSVNASGTRLLLESVLENAPGARVLSVGSGEIYGPQPEGTRVAEDAPFRPVSPYAFSKAAADEIGAAFALRGLDIVRTRSFSHTGPGQTSQFALPSFALQIAKIERGESEPVLRVGNLEVVRDILDVRDVVEGYLQLIERGEQGGAYNVCSGRGVRLLDVVGSLCAMARESVTVEVDPERVRTADVPYLVGDPARIESATGWTPRRPLEQTLRDLLDSWRAKGPEV